MKRNLFKRKLRRALAASLGVMAFSSSAYVANAITEQQVVQAFASMNYEQLNTGVKSTILSGIDRKYSVQRLNEAIVKLNIDKSLNQQIRFSAYPDQNPNIRYKIKITDNNGNWIMDAKLAALRKGWKLILLPPNYDKYTPTPNVKGMWFTEKQKQQEMSLLDEWVKDLWQSYLRNLVQNQNDEEDDEDDDEDDIDNNDDNANIVVNANPQVNAGGVLDADVQQPGEVPNPPGDIPPVPEINNVNKNQAAKKVVKKKQTKTGNSNSVKVFEDTRQNEKKNTAILESSTAIAGGAFTAALTPLFNSVAPVSQPIQSTGIGITSAPQTLDVGTNASTTAPNQITSTQSAVTNDVSHSAKNKN